jgi:hypothetical protein
MVYTFDATECGTHGGRYVRPPRDRMLPKSAFRQMFGNRGPTLKLALGLSLRLSA